jgi:hypothetical protein
MSGRLFKHLTELGKLGNHIKDQAKERLPGQFIMIVYKSLTVMVRSLQHGVLMVPVMANLTVQKVLLLMSQVMYT